MRIALADDQKLVRQGFRLILAAEPDITVVAEASNGVEAIDVVRQATPDVVLMDVQMPVMDGIEATTRIREFSDVKIVILTTFDRDDYLFDALDAGASGFMLKNAEADLLVTGLRQVAEGHALLAPEVTRRVIARSASRLAKLDRRVENLTSREIEVTRLVARGLSNAEIAAELTVSEATVKTHVSSCLTKCDLRDRVQLVVLAYESGLIHVGESESS
ncbi:response regulator transcription factor [Propionibacterium sp. NM47_B9-13]|jgi:DNA-binding NarL/FixJ family response regulator|uniref:DNA-binding response regulator n=2 Tax=Cutibacterium modestum TaxID=2559073 RepID=A0AAD1KNZ0_9ACTN|nr:response regulator transcription factor [Cutibacterium modestum]TGY29501.1 response regulator transcription factor [Propionibacterium sp. NM47_B9-13]AOH44738.1 DNA-binding response regulator [Cutibacterium modestum]EFS74998.1 response regulator receiver domain protein [Cutibacterium modestum HL037PA2]EFS91873.1 response regulator receiver domain protein [Cutibacterium modestum HL044PA1]EFT16153.1 response regulator receiver domain protein [Cutibacterium modestum HL037PA3]